MIKYYLTRPIKKRKYLGCVPCDCLQMLSLFVRSLKKSRSFCVGALMMAGLVAFVGGCGVDAPSSHLSGALRDSGVSEDKSGFYLDINGDLEGASFPEELLEDGEFSQEDIDFLADLDDEIGALSGDGYPIVYCSDTESDDPDKWDCADWAWMRIPQELVDAPSESDLENLTLAIHTLQESVDGESIQKIEKFLINFNQHGRSSAFYKDITKWGLFFVGAQRTIDLILKHTDIKDMQKLPKFLKFVSHLGLRRNLLHFARARIITFGAPLLAVGGGGLWWNSHRIRSNMLESVVFKDPGSDGAQMKVDDGVAVYPTLRTLLHSHINSSEESSKSSGDENLVVDVPEAELALLSLELALKLIEKEERNKNQQRVGSLLRDSLK